MSADLSLDGQHTAEDSSSGLGGIPSTEGGGMIQAQEVERSPGKG